jgi:hypothetical protein
VLLLICSTPDYITPDAPQIPSCLESDKVRRFCFEAIYIFCFISILVLVNVHFVIIKFLFLIQENVCPKSPEKSTIARSKRYKRGFLSYTILIYIFFLFRNILFIYQTMANLRFVNYECSYLINETFFIKKIS